MIGRIVEVADDKRHLLLHRGFMVVRDTEGERKELGQIPLDDIAAVIANAHGLSYTNNLLVALAERGAPFVLCAANHNAVGMLLPIKATLNSPNALKRKLPPASPHTSACGPAWCAPNLHSKQLRLKPRARPPRRGLRWQQELKAVTLKIWKHKARAATGVCCLAMLSGVTKTRGVQTAC